MYTDTSRLADLKELKAELDDVTQPMIVRKRAYRSYKKILSQLHDPKLASLRERLLKATLASDKTNIWKLTNLVKDHLKEEIFKEGRY